MASLPFLFFTLSLLLPFSAPRPTARTGFRARLTHVEDAGPSLSPLEAVARSLARDRSHLRRISCGRAGGFEARMRAAPGEYHLSMTVGTPPVPVTGLMDTGSDLIWTNCSTSGSGGDPSVFFPKKSLSFSNVSCSSGLCKALTEPVCGSGGSCNYSYVYGDNSFSEGFLGADVFELGDGRATASARVRFGCGVRNEGNGMSSNRGVVGFGRGPLSLVSQLGVKRFAYCLSRGSRRGNASSLLLVGSAVGRGEGSRSTRILENPANPTYYYVGLEGISVGGTRLGIPKEMFEIGEGGFGGVIVDSGTSVTMLTEDAYDVVRRAVAAETKAEVTKRGGLGGLDLCFELPPGGGRRAAERFPGMVFHFKGMDLKLPPENIVIVDLDKKLMCLAMGPSGPLSVIGNWQQQDVMVTYDVEKGRMSMVQKSCQTV